MRIAYADVQFELTRRCNQSCRHCCRGKSEELDLSKEVIDAFFDKNSIHSIGTILFSGGEPTLNGKGLQYLVKKLIEKHVEVGSFMLSINGLSFSQEFYDALVELNDYCSNFALRPREKYGILFVSQSQYHKKALPEVIEKFRPLPFFTPPSGIQRIKRANILPYGNAVKNKLTDALPDFNKIKDYNSGIKITEYQKELFLVFERQYISSNGNVLVDGCMSYDMMDTYQIGNVLEKPIVEMFSTQPKMLMLRRE